MDPSNLFDLSDRAAIRDTIDNKCKAKEWSASTSKLYFDSVSYFFQYLLENKSEIVTSECEFRLRNVVNSIPRWKTALRELVKEQKVSLHQRQKTLFHTKKDVEDFMNGNEFKSNADLIRRLSESETGFSLSPHQHSSLIRTLVTLVLLRSPKRAGILAHLDMEEYNKKTLVQEEYVIEVKKSKTYAACGAAQLPLTKLQVHWFDTYISRVRLNLPQTSSGSSNVFLKSNGHAHTPGDISSHLQVGVHRFGSFS